MKNRKRIKYDGAAPLPILLYLLSVCAALMYTICRSQFLPCMLAMSAVTSGIFVLFYKMRFRPVVTSLSIFALTLVSWVTGSAAGAHMTEDDSFMSFLFTASARFDIIYAAAAILIFSLVIGFIGCYFSVISPRPCFLMLLMFIPVILSSRTARELPVYLLLIMAGCFIFACANLSVPVPAESHASFEEKSSRRSRTAISCAAAVVITLIAAVLPRSSNTPLAEALDSIVPQQRGYYGNAGLSNYISRSSVNTGVNKPTGGLLFTVDTEAPGNLVRWSFDTYTEKGWVLLDRYDSGYAGWEYNASVCSPADLVYQLKNSEDRLPEESRRLLSGISATEPVTASTGISIRDSSATQVVLHPAGIYRAVLPEECGRTYRTPRGEIFTEKMMPQYCTYYLLHHYDRPNRAFMRRVDYDSYEALIQDAADCGVITQSMQSALIEQHRQAEEYRRYTLDSAVTPEIQELADEITEGLDSDIDKALAIEKWFGEAGFVYDMEFAPEEPGTEYFLFRSRRGICSDFATALTLLARAAGLPARYTEGYAVPDSTYDEDTGLYHITDAEAHAWTRIYVPGGGWLDFDGTKYAQAAEKDNSVPVWLYICIAAAAAAVLAIVFRRQIGWLAFSVTYPLRSGEKQIRGVFLYARKLAAQLTGEDEMCLAAGEVCRILTVRLGMPAEAEEICGAADALFYGAGSSDGINTKRLIKDIRALRKRRRRIG